MGAQRGHADGEGHVRSAFFCRLLQHDVSFQVLGQVVCRMLVLIEGKLTNTFLHELGEAEDLEHSESDESESWADLCRVWAQTRSEFLKRAAICPQGRDDVFQQSSTLPYRTLEDDPWAQICSMVQHLDKMKSDMEDLQRTMLEAL